MLKASHKITIKFLLFLAAIILLLFLGSRFKITTESLDSLLHKFPFYYAAIIFIVLYVIVTFFIWLSKDVFRFVAAFIFGAYLSTLFVFIAEIINACILFHFSRLLGRDFVQSKISAKYIRLDEKIKDSGFFWLLMFRTVPLVPFRFLDLAAGLTGVSFRKYLLAVILGSPIRIFWVQYILSGVGKGVLTNPDLLLNYLLLNKAAYIFSFIYLILVVIVALKMRKV